MEVYMNNTVLQVEHLKTYFSRSDGLMIKAVDDVSFSIERGETLCVVGESGSGKSMTALSVMGLVPKPRGQIVGGSILFEGRDLVKLSEQEMCNIRGNKISMIFQEPMTSLNPVKTIGNQVAEALIEHNKATRKEANEQAVEMLRMVGIARAEKVIREYPHQLSGGMRQRAMIAMALICKPALLIADEPTTALDVTIQAQVLDLIRELKARTNTAVLFITHDLGVVSEMADRVIVMYAGQVVEAANVRDIFKNAMHPYTRALLNSIPFMDQDKEVLYSIRGVVPDAAHFPAGCRFRERCDEHGETQCVQTECPGLVKVGADHYVRCFQVGKEGTL